MFFKGQLQACTAAVTEVLYRGEHTSTGWLSQEHHTAVTRGTSHLHANQRHGDPAAALWCKWAVITHGRRRGGEWGRRTLESCQGGGSFHTPSILTVESLQPDPRIEPSVPDLVLHFLVTLITYWVNNICSLQCMPLRCLHSGIFLLNDLKSILNILRTVFSLWFICLVD